MVQASAQQKRFLEKITLYYDKIFKGESLDVAFWNELFLLWSNTNYLEQLIATLPADALIKRKKIVNEFFARCVLTLDGGGIKAVNSLRNLCGLVKGLGKQKCTSGFGFDLIDLLMGFDQAESLMQRLVERLIAFLSGDYPLVLKSQSVHLLLVCVTVADNLNQNSLVDYLTISSIYEPIIEVLASSSLRESLGHDCILLLTFLINYKKNEALNPYVIKLSILDDQLALNGYCQVIGASLSSHCGLFKKSMESSKSSGLLSSLTNIVGSVLISEEPQVESIRTDDSMLLAMYEAVHLNRNFVSILSSAPTECSHDLPGILSSGEDLDPERSNSGVTATSSNDTLGASSLLVSFLSYSSIVMQQLKDECHKQSAKLCLIILTCIAEDQYANSVMHDSHLLFRVPLYRAPMRHRKAGFDETPESRPLASAVFDVCTEFLLSHLMRALPIDLHSRCIGIIHKLLCYQKKARTRLQYQWRNLWNSFATLLRFILSHEDCVIGYPDIFPLLQQIIRVINLFVTFGDTFLPNPSSYDELYYEIIRNAEVFENLIAMALRHASGESVHKNAASKLCAQMANIQNILNHFKSKIEQHPNFHGGLSDQEVISVIRANYNSLNLKLQDSLDIFERYSETPIETCFFMQTMKTLVLSYRRHLEQTTLDQQTVIRELSNIS